GDILRMFPRNDIYVRYLADNRGVVAELATEFFGRPVRVEIASEDSPISAEPMAASSGGQEVAPPPETTGIAAEIVRVDPAPQTSSGSEGPRKDDRAEIYSDPGMRRIFDAFGARLVEVRTPRAVKEQGGS